MAELCLNRQLFPGTPHCFCSRWPFFPTFMCFFAITNFVFLLIWYNVANLFSNPLAKAKSEIWTRVLKTDLLKQHFKTVCFHSYFQSWPVFHIFLQRMENKILCALRYSDFCKIAFCPELDGVTSIIICRTYSRTLLLSLWPQIVATCGI